MDPSVVVPASIVTAGAVSFGLVEILKPALAQVVSPNSGLYTTLVRVLAVGLSMAWLALAQWVGPVGLHSLRDVGVLVLATLPSALSSFGLYQIKSTVVAARQPPGPTPTNITPVT